jgi:leader peptidase (prepilin peptidase)/N-methyltransferase
MEVSAAMTTVFDGQAWASVPAPFWAVLFFVLGCIVGSFLNVCIHRMPLGQSIVTPPSHCPACNYSIPIYLNVPLVTWLMLRGKCANCRAIISARYFLVELLTGLLFLACWFAQRHQSAGAAIVLCIFVSGLVVATFIDLEHYIIPDEITIGGAIVGFVCSALVPALHHTTRPVESLRSSFWGILVGGILVEAVRQAGKLAFGRENINLDVETRVLFTETALVLPERIIPYDEMFFRKTDTIRFHARRLELLDRCFTNVRVSLSALRLQIGKETFDPEPLTYMEALTDQLVRPREAMGFGDVKFMAAIGAFLGWPATIFCLMASSVIGLICAGSLILLGKRDRSAQIPFGPYIAAAAVLWIFAGDAIIRWLLVR